MIDGGKVDTKKLLVRTATGALVGSLFNRPGTGAAIGALTALGGGGKILTYYYADWCPYCVNFKPEWKKLSKMLKEQGWTVKEFNIDSGGEKMERAGVKSIPAVVYEIGDKQPVVIKGISKMSAPEIVSEISGGKVRKSRQSPGILSSAGAAVSGLLSVPARLLGMKRSKSPRRLNGGAEKWTLWGGEAPVEGGEAPVVGGEIEGGKRRRSPRRMRGGEIEGGKRRRSPRMRGGEAPVEGGEVKVEGGEIEGGKRHRSPRRMRGGAVEGGEVEGGEVKVEGGEIEGGKRRYRMRGGAVEGGEVKVEGGEVKVEGGEIEGGRRRYRMRGGAVEGGEVKVEGGEVEGGEIEGGKRHRSPRRMYGGAVEGGEVKVEGGEIEGGRRRYRMRGGEVPVPEVAGGEIEGGRRRSYRMRGGEVPVPEVAGGEIEGGRKLSAYNLHMRKYMNEHKGEKGAFSRGAAMWRARM